MKQSKALLVTTLVARRASNWAHDIVTSVPGDVADTAMQRFARDIRSALDILTDQDDDEAPQ